jgi:hypothetical protein
LPSANRKLLRCRARSKRQRNLVIESNPTHHSAYYQQQQHRHPDSELGERLAALI